MAEFTVLTPFPHTTAFEDLHRQNRILSYDWNEYSADRVVYQPAGMSPERLQEIYHYAWDLFYRDEPQPFKMFKLLQQVSRKEMQDNTYRPRKREFASQAFGEKVV